jgi:pSer/pThr/pTyr-binding forkhead associated (FHA) protein
VPTPTATPGTAGEAPPTPTAPSADATSQARVVAVRYGAPSGEEIPLFGQRLVVGRFDPETGPVDIDLSALDPGGHVSRQHGELYREADGSWMVRDLGSTNGIFVKGADATSFGPRISAPRPLADGDELAFGNARFIFKMT